MVIRLTPVAAVAAVAIVPLFGVRAAHAQWVNNGTAIDTTNSTSHVEGGGGNLRTTSTASSTAASSGSPPTSYWNYQTVHLDTSFSWSGGGTATTSFTVPGSGTLDGSVTTTGSAAGTASSGVSGPGFSSS